jgi:hypothetical protein
MWNLVPLHLETPLESAQGRCTVCAKRRSEIILECAQWYFLVTRLKWLLVLVYFEIVLIFMQDKCTVCVERSIRSEIILDAPDGSPM